MNEFEPTSLNQEDYDIAVRVLLDNQINYIRCSKCSKIYFTHGYGVLVQKCDECKKSIYDGMDSNY